MISANDFILHWINPTSQMIRFWFTTLLLLVTYHRANSQSFDYTFDWSRNSSPNIISSANTLAMDSAGNSYIAGSYVGGYLALGSISLNAIASSYVAKLNPNGHTIWLRAVGVNENASINKVKFDRSGNLLMSGVFTSSTLTIGMLSVQNNSQGQQDAFIAKLDTAGNCMWLRSMGGENNDVINDFIVQSDNSIEFIGAFKSDTLFADTLSLVSQNVSMDQNFVGLLTTNGHFSWLVHIGNSQFQNITSVALATEGASIIVGHESSDIAIFKLDSAGNQIWNKVFLADPFEIDQANEVVYDTINQFLYLVGYFESPFIDFDSISFGGFSGRKGFLLKTDSVGNAIWMKPLRGNGDANVQNVAMNVAGDVLVSGDFYSTKFYPELLDTIYNQSYVGYSDCYISSYKPDGTRNWTKQFGSVYDEVISDLQTFSNKLMIAGSYGSPFFTIPGTITMFNNTGHEVMFVAEADNFVFTETKSIKSSNEWKVYPNPSSAQIQVANSYGTFPDKLVVKDISGKKVLEIYNHTLSVKDLEDGIYMLEVHTGDRIGYSSFIKNE